MNRWLKIWFGILASKLAIGAFIPLSQDESYYWVWSQHLQLSYFDHPPAVAWLFKIGSWLPEFAIRWPGIFVAHLGLFFWRKLFEEYLTEMQQTTFLLLAGLMPILGPGSLIVTPDSPLMLTWPLALYFGLQFSKNPTQIKNILGLGVSLGLAALSKYHAVLLVPIIAYWISGEKNWRRSLLPLCKVGALAIIFSSPVWLWNAQNNWASFAFQIGHGLGGKVWKPNWTIEYIGAQVGLIFPTIIFLALSSPLKKKWLMAAAFPLGFFLLTSFRGYVEANWPIMAHPVMLALAISSQKPSRKIWLKITGITWAALTVIVVILSVIPRLPDWASKTKLRDLHEFDGITFLSQSASPLYVRSYQMASQLSYRLKRPIYKLAGMNRRDFFDELPESTPEARTFYLWIYEDDILPSPFDKWNKSVLLKLNPNFLLLKLEAP